jgi:predicted SAM-dependent methyltransferase
LRASETVKPDRVERLHVGCGRSAIPGWVNVDLFDMPGVDRVLDVSEGLPFADVSFIFAEHFLEHLSLQEGLAFLRGCRRVLAPAGVLRLSTPNLDWVMKTHYRAQAWATDEDAFEDCVRLNRAFHGWGHQFLYNHQMLAKTLRIAGFETVTFHFFGESDRPELAGLERHEPSLDTRELPHVVIAQATGVAPPIAPPELFRIYRRDLLAR